MMNRNMLEEEMERTERNNERVQLIAEPIVHYYGYENCEATMEPFRVLKAKWTRGQDTLNLRISDYLETAPDYALESVIETVVSRIVGKEIKSYSERTLKWLNSEAFLEANQTKYMRRSRVNESQDRHRLENALDSLIEKGLVKRDDRMKLFWSPGQMLGTDNTSILMKVGIISRRFDRPEVPDEVIEYLVYKCIRYMEQEMGEEPPSAKEFNGLIKDYPGKEELEGWMVENGYLGEGI